MTFAWTLRGRRIMFFFTAAAVSALFGYAVTRVPPVLLFGAILGAIAATMVMIRPFIGLLLYAVVFILRPGEMSPVLGALHLERVVGAMTLVAIFVGQLRKEGGLFLDWSPQTRWFLAFVACISISIPFSYYRFGAVTTFTDMLKILAFYLMIVYLVDTRRRLRVFVVLYMLLISYLAVSSLTAYYGGQLLFAQGIERAEGVTGAGGGPNELGTTMASIFPLFAFFFLSETRKWKKMLAGAGAGMSMWTMVLTGSRASLLGFMGSLVYLWWLSRHKVLLGALGVIGLTATFFVLPQQYRQRYQTITSEHIDGSSQARLVTWVAGLHMLVEHPLTGVGAGCFGTAHAMAYSPPGHKMWLESHSLYIQVMAELGFIGAFAFFGFIRQILRLNRAARSRIEKLGRGWRWEHALMGALFAGVLCLLISGVFGHSLYRRTWYVYAGLGLAVFRMVMREREAEASPATDPAKAP
jgi:probable O-glycosylation ligase (exosortase A-associated)